MKKYNKYGEIAIKAVSILRSNKKKLGPREAWQEACLSLQISEAMREKGCPRDAFLGLCEAGYIDGVPEGEYTRSKKNKDYALKAYSLIKSNPDKYLEMNKKEFWNEVSGKAISHNSQLDVVLSLIEIKALRY